MPLLCPTDAVIDTITVPEASDPNMGTSAADKAALLEARNAARASGIRFEKNVMIGDVEEKWFPVS